MPETIEYHATVSVALIHIFLNYLRKIGIDTDELCKSVGIGISILKDMDARISFKRFGLLWEEAVKKANDSNFGIHCIKDAALHYPSGHILFSVMLNCPDIEQAMIKFFHFHDLMNDVVKPKMEIHDELFYVTWDLTISEFKLPRHITEALICVYFFILKNLTQNKFELIEVHFSHRQPQDISEHQRLFRAPLKFGQARSKLVVHKKYLSYPIYWANPELLKTLEQYANTKMEKIYQDDTWSYKTVQMISQQMAQGEKVSLNSLAQKMGLSSRNLQNKLKSENNTFQNIFDDIRKTVACQSLDKENFSIVDTAFLLGFSEQSAFNHAFKRWTGSTPREYIKIRSKR